MTTGLKKKKSITIRHWLYYSTTACMSLQRVQTDGVQIKWTYSCYSLYIINYKLNYVVILKYI